MQNSTTATTPIVTAKATDWTKIQRTDVLCNNQMPYARHTGNHLYALIVAKYINGHPPVVEVKERVKAALNIIKTVRQEHHGRFLAKTKRGTWKDIGDKLAVKWISLHFKRINDKKTTPVSTPNMILQTAVNTNQLDVVPMSDDKSTGAISHLVPDDEEKSLSSFPTTASLQGAVRETTAQWSPVPVSAIQFDYECEIANQARLDTAEKDLEERYATLMSGTAAIQKTKIAKFSHAKKRTSPHRSLILQETTRRDKLWYVSGSP
uniref:DUF6824 domain-containing protein n=1 Tax=Cyclophora tenuis TaxID=216820 RepID=A0A7S1DAZ9_CYCTE|mmetsp:Transcript_4113/g.7074  ORF Transcript_4113/g.7074 Transcript_4113/m.7074 type:complete len:264 (+) Transcript_4113:19-810(+)